MLPIACYQATGQHYAHSALNDRFPAILNAQNPAIPSAHPQHGKGCPLITRIYTNEYFAVNLILRHKIKLTASASVLLVLISAIRG